MRQQAERLLPALQAALGDDWTLSVEPMFSQIGSGALPVDALPSCGVVIRTADGKRSGRRLKALAAQLRALPRAVIGRVATMRCGWIFAAWKRGMRPNSWRSGCACMRQRSELP